MFVMLCVLFGAMYHTLVPPVFDSPSTQRSPPLYVLHLSMAYCIRVHPPSRCILLDVCISVFLRAHRPPYFVVTVRLRVAPSGAHQSASTAVQQFRALPPRSGGASQATTAPTAVLLVARSCCTTQLLAGSTPAYCREAHETLCAYSSMLSSFSRVFMSALASAHATGTHTSDCSELVHFGSHFESPAFFSSASCTNSIVVVAPTAASSGSRRGAGSMLNCAARTVRRNVMTSATADSATSRQPHIPRSPRPPTSLTRLRPALRPPAEALRVLSWNCTSMPIPRLAQFVAELSIREISVACLQEVRWHPLHNPPPPFIGGYRIHYAHHCATDHQHCRGGAAVLVRTDIIAFDRPEYSTPLCAKWLEIRLQDAEPVLIGTAYVRPYDEETRLIPQLDSALGKLPKLALFCGDFNSRNLLWDPRTPHSGRSKTGGPRSTPTEARPSALKSPGPHVSTGRMREHNRPGVCNPCCICAHRCFAAELLPS